MPLTPRDLAWFAANAIVLGWNVLVARRVIASRRGSSVFLSLTALAGLLLLPGAVVAITAATLPGGRAVNTIEWLWPLVLLAALAQSAHALVRGTVTSLLGLPVVVCNAMLLASALARYATTRIDDPSPYVAALGAAHAGVMSFALGRGALLSPLAFQVPVLAPSYAAQYRLAKPFRAALSLWSALAAILFVAEYPRAVFAAMTFSRMGNDRLQERPAHDLAVGLRLFGDLGAAPTTPAIREDLAVADSLQSRLLLVVLRPSAATPRTLDSLARSLERRRRAGSALVVALGYGWSDRRAIERDADAYAASRLEVVDEVVRRLRPEFLMPALDPNDAGERALGEQPSRWWRGWLRDAAALAHRIRPATRVGVSMSSWTAPDSELYAWASAPGTAMDFIGLTFRPSYGGGASLAARYHLAERWMRGSRKPHMVVASGAYPRLFGDHRQGLALWSALVWTTEQLGVQWFVVDGAGDYESLTGLRAAGGRLRPALDMLVRAKQAVEGER